MDDLALAEETDNVVYIGVIGHSEDVVIGHSRLLLCGQIFGQITDYISLDANRCRSPRSSGGKLRINACGMINEIRSKIRHAYVVILEISGELMNNGPYDFQMCQFLCACRGGAMEECVQNPCGPRLWVVEQRRNRECTKTGVAV